MAYQIAFGIPIFIKVFLLSSSAIKAIEKSPFYLGSWSQFLGFVALGWQATTSVILLLPTLLPVDAFNFNYCVVVVSLVTICGVINYEFNARYYFKGAASVIPKSAKKVYHVISLVPESLIPSRFGGGGRFRR